MSKSRKILWTVWGVASPLLAGFLFMSLKGTDGTGAVSAAVFLPNDTTSGHHQIELVCTTCHVESFGGPELVQQACVECHEKEFERVDDSHPKKKFTDPRNVDTLTNIDARRVSNVTPMSTRSTTNNQHMRNSGMMKYLAMHRKIRVCLVLHAICRVFGMKTTMVTNEYW